MRRKSAPNESGFTLVELVTVLILIGVLSALGVGLFASRSAFSPLLATQQLASATLLAQQAALAGNPATRSQSSAIQMFSGLWLVVAPVTSGLLRSPTRVPLWLLPATLFH